MSRSRTPDEDPTSSEFENLLGCAAEALRARAIREQAELGIKISKAQSQNEQDLEGTGAKTRPHLNRPMSNTSSRAKESLPTSDRRRHARQRIKSLSYLDLGRDNGGIVLNISEGGLAVHAVGIFVDNPILQMHFRLPESDEPLEASGQVAWTSESKREAGIHFIDLPEEARKQIKQWLSKQTPSAESQTDEGSVREKKKQVLEIPPRREPKTSVAEPAMISGMTNEEFNAMFPSEKNPVPWREFESPAARFTVSVAPSATPHVSILPSEGAAQDRLEAKTPTMDSSSTYEGQDRTATEENPEMLDPPKSSTLVPSSTTLRDGITTEELLIQVPAEEAAPALPQSFSPAAFSGPVAHAPAMPDVLPPVSHSDNAIPQSAVGAAFTESQPAIRPFDEDIASPRATESGTPKPVEVETPAGSSPSALPISVEPEAPPLSSEGATASRLENDSPMEVQRPSAETRSSAEMVRDLRATLNRAGAIRKSAARHKVAKQESQTLPPSDSAATVPPLVAAPIATAQSVTPSRSAASLPLSDPDRPAPAQPQVKSPMTEILSGAPISSESDKRPSQFSKEIGKFAKSFWQLSGVRWQPSAVLILVFVVLLAIGMAFNRGTFDRLRGSAGSSAKSSFAQATPPAPDNAVNVPQAEHVNPEVQRDNRRELASAGSAITASVERQHRQRLGGLAVTPQKTFVPALSPPIVANRQVQAGTSEEESPPAIPAQPDKASGDSLGIAAAGSWDSAPKLAPPQPTTQIAEQGDRVVACSLLYRVEAMYPPEAAQKHIEGTVKLRAVIGRDGRVMGLGVVSGPPSLVPAAISAAREWRYIPALLNGEPVESETDITIEFRLSHEADR